MLTNPIENPTEPKRTPEEKQAVMDCITRVFNSPDGVVALAEFQRIVDAEDIPLFNIRDCNAYAHYCSGRRSMLKTIKNLSKIKGVRS